MSEHAAPGYKRFLKLSRIDGLPSGRSGEMRSRLTATYVLLFSFNVGTWIWAVMSVTGRPQFLGVAFVIYGLGLRHAVDADHIAAIDNVTRKLMQAGQQPVLVGFWFALGHSAIVTAVAASVVAATSLLGTYKHLEDLGGTISTCISAVFLLAIAAMNIAIFACLYRCYRRIRAGGSFVEADMDQLLNGRGLISRLLRPLFRLVTRSWHMLALGVLFGLGFDTATEIAMYSLSASQVASGLPVHAILVYPALFAAGMALVDTTDSVMMVGAYRWALNRPMRRLFYNMTITLVSIFVAIGIGGIEALDLIGSKFTLTGGAWTAANRLRENFNILGFVIIGIFIAAWAISYLVYRCKGLDDVEAGDPA